MANRNQANTRHIASPIDDAWTTVVDDGKAATTNPYRVATLAAQTKLQMFGFTGFVVRAKYISGETLSSTIACFGHRKNTGEWMILKDVDGDRTNTLVSGANDVDDTTNGWTDHTAKYDAHGCDEIVVTVPSVTTAPAGAVSIEAARM